MKLASFQVKDFRSINDSGPIPLDGRCTVLVGRNESGKSSLLRALHSLKPPPPAGMPAWGLARDFPRTRRRSEYREDITVLETKWTLDDADRMRLEDVWPRARTATTMTVARSYAPKPTVRFSPMAPLEALANLARSAAAAIVTHVTSSVWANDGEAVRTAASGLVDVLARDVEAPTWGPDGHSAAQTLRNALTTTGSAPPEQLETLLHDVESNTAAVAKDNVSSQEATAWAMNSMPVFVYLDDWTFVPGHYNIDEYLQRTSQNTATPQDKLFEKLLKVAELDAHELQRLLPNNHEERKLLTDRASNVVTDILQGLWKDREVTVQFSVDAGHFDVIVKDKDSNALVPLDERSRGFRWYFSFFITFAADTQGGDKEHAILLLDEPGLFLHATAQGSLLDFFARLNNQIIYTTHSPFMIDPAALTRTRTVNLTRREGTTVSIDSRGDANTLFPLQAALGYSLTQTLFVGNETIVVEGVTDYWYLTAVSGFLVDQGHRGLEANIVLTPAWGAARVSYMVSLLTAQRLQVVVLFDSDVAGNQAVKELLGAKLIRDDCIVRVSAAFGASQPTEADIEDLFEPDVYVDLAREAYARELSGAAPLTLNPNIPRVVRRLEEAFRGVGLEFNKTRAARLFLTKMASAPGSVVTGQTADRFDRLITSLNQAVAKLKAAARAPFA